MISQPLKAAGCKTGVCMPRFIQLSLWRALSLITRCPTPPSSHTHTQPFRVQMAARVWETRDPLPQSVNREAAHWHAGGASPPVHQSRLLCGASGSWAVTTICSWHPDFVQPSLPSEEIILGITINALQSSVTVLVVVEWWRSASSCANRPWIW